MLPWRKQKPATVDLPSGRHFAVTWAVSHQFGGMTNVLFHRSKALARLGRRDIDIVTFDYNDSYDSVRRTLERGGYLVKGLRVVNMWEQLADPQNPPVFPPQADVDLSSFEPLDTTHPVINRAGTSGGPSRRRRMDNDSGSVMQTDYFRVDGSMYLSDRLDGFTAEGKATRTVFFCDLKGTPVRRWNSMTGLYHAWLDALSGGQAAYFIVDSKFSARFMSSYRRANSVVLHLVHGSHLARAKDGPHSRLSVGRIDAFAKVDQYDSLVFLTQEQCNDALERYQGADNFSVIPNSRAAVETSKSAPHRDTNALIVVARLSRVKRLDHAIRAVVKARHDSGHPLMLDIYGDGEDRERLEGVIADLNAGDFIKLRGHTESVNEAFAGASMSLLTSSTEGFGLVLVESLAVGCIPIAYNIKYGPSFVIDEGRDGFLVPDGDIDALAASIVATRNLSDADVRALRQHGIQEASRFGDEEISRLWAKEMQRAAARKARPSPELSAAVSSSGVTFESGGRTTLFVEIQVAGDPDSAAEHFAVLVNRGDGTWQRVQAARAEDRAGGRYLEFVLPPSLVASLEGQLTDVSIESRLLNSRIRTRVPLEGVGGHVQVYSTKYGNMSFR